jgi:hypothetical protein
MMSSSGRLLEVLEDELRLGAAEVHPELAVLLQASHDNGYWIGSGSLSGSLSW